MFKGLFRHFLKSWHKTTMKNYLKPQGQSVWVTLQYSDISSDNSHIWPLKYGPLDIMIMSFISFYLKWGNFSQSPSYWVTMSLSLGQWLHRGWYSSNRVIFWPDPKLGRGIYLPEIRSTWLSFSQFNVLMSTPNCEDNSTLEQLLVQKPSKGWAELKNWGK